FPAGYLLGLAGQTNPTENGVYRTTGAGLVAAPPEAPKVFFVVGVLSDVHETEVVSTIVNRFQRWDTAEEEWVAAAPATTIAQVTGLTSALDGKVTALGSATGLWVGTETEYGAIGSPDAATVYVVVADP